MCGIAGVMNASGLAGSKDFIRDAMVAGMLRGYDSSGIFQQDNKGKIYYHKEASEGMFLAFSKKGGRFIDDVPSTHFTVTHTRAATQGKVTDENAHPFVTHKPDGSPIVGCHNGSLEQSWRNKPNAKDYEVDSHWALAEIAEKGIKAFDNIFGAYCFVWAEVSKPGKLFMVRNSQRPMHLLWSADGKQCYFASEAGMLSWLCERNKLVVKEEIMVLGTDKLYEFDMTDDKVTFTSTPLRTYNYTPVQQTTAASTVVSNPTVLGSAVNAQLNHAGKQFIEDIKKAAQGKLPIRQGGWYQPPKRDILDDQDAATEAAVTAAEAAIVEQRNDDAPFSMDEFVTADLVPESWFSSSSKPEEVALAKAEGMHRELQWFEGVVWDEETGSLMGDIEVWNKSTGKETYTGIIRTISRARAHAEYIDNGNKHKRQTNGNWVVVDGMYDDSRLGLVMVLSELNQIGKQHMADQYRKAN